MLELIEPIKIFDQFIFLSVIQLNNIAWRKLFGENEGKNEGHTKRRSLNRNRL